MINYLPLFIYKEYYSKSVEDELTDFLKDLVFNKLNELLNNTFLKYYNSTSPGKTILKAILSGKIQYIGGEFVGAFNSTISKQLRNEGAIYDKKNGSYKINITSLHRDIQLAIGTSNSSFKHLYEDVLSTLDNAYSIFDDKKLTINALKVIDSIDRDFLGTVRRGRKPPELSDSSKKAIVNNYITNLELNIKGFSKQEIIDLRKKVFDSTFNNTYRADKLANLIQSSYDISIKRAQFIARQETRLLLATFREERYRSLGYNSYKWVTVGDARVRPDHKSLNGSIFTWDNPPIINRSTGKRGHPGQDYNCRCLPKVIINEKL